MPLISYYCRTCSDVTHHKIEGFDESGEHMNYAKLNCIKCPTDAFVVEYSKQTNAPTATSRRVNEEGGKDEC